MTTQFFKRPSANYAGETGLPNRTKYFLDSTASPKVPISSTKVDGDINYLIDAVNTLYDTAVSGVVADGSVTNVKLRDSGACSVIGRAANTTGSPADISAATNNTVLVRKSDQVQFSTIPAGAFEMGSITNNDLQDATVGFGKIQNVNTGVVLGRSSSGTGPIEALTAGTGLTLSAGVISVPNASTTASGIVELATTAETQTGTDTTRAVTPAGLFGGLNATGTAPIYAARAWVNFNGTGTVAIRASGNVSSITDNGVGDYTVNFTTAMPDANYAVVFGINGGRTATANTGLDATNILNKIASAVRIVTGGSTNYADVSDISVIIHR